MKEKTTAGLHYVQKFLHVLKDFNFPPLPPCVMWELSVSAVEVFYSNTG